MAAIGGAATAVNREVFPFEVAAKAEAASTSTAGATSKPRDAQEEPSVITKLFGIIQNRELTAAEKNLKFVQELGKVQLAAFKRVTLQTEFSAHGLTFAMSSANMLLPNSASEVASNGLPFYVLDKNVQRLETATLLKNDCGLPSDIADLALEYVGTRIDFRSVVLPPAIQTEINQEASTEQKKLVPAVQTLQDWAYSESRGYDIIIPDAMPDITSDAYSVVTFVPVQIDGTKKVGQWNPFFKGPNGPYIILTYINDETNQQAQGGGTGFLQTAGRQYFVLQDSSKKKHNWNVESITNEEAASAATVAKVKKVAMNFTIIPLHSMDSPSPVMEERGMARGGGDAEEVRYRGAAVAPSYGRVGVGQQTAQTYKTTNVYGRHKVEAEQTVHVQVRPIPIDVSGLKTEEELESYLNSLGKMVIELAEIGGKQAVALSQEKLPVVPASESNTLLQQLATGFNMHCKLA